jgi:hypothetical protein
MCIKRKGTSNSNRGITLGRYKMIVKMKMSNHTRG